MAKEMGHGKWYIIGGIIIVALIVLIIYTNSNKSSGTTCNKPYILVGSSCCLDQNGNNVCDTDEQATNVNNNPSQNQQQAQTQPFCGDGTCNNGETCSSCSSDCGGCSAKILVLRTITSGDFTEDAPFDCSGYNDGVCVNQGSNNFKIYYAQSPNKYLHYGLETTIENVGDKESGRIISSFRCLENGGVSTSVSSDGGTINGVVIQDYFTRWNDIQVQEIPSLGGRQDSNNYNSYILAFDTANIQKSFDMTCTITLDGSNPSISESRTLSISMIK